ncbi:hypothetical protein EPJ70_09155 [Brachyspira aalborgi]|uniref:Uncharacterized protein n=1 Tax=Brachyspira aalborgi TaxID=29522 RepID=A0A5C8F4F8_9SPIR|nr:hypothetical protein [Brachyspira aalborgi]TXJ44379.1 hypothetical protein EPJ70_09155 [Brachyspira aalborgi]
MFDKNNNVSIFVYIAILLNAIIIALFIAFVFGLKKDAFDVDTKKLDRSSLICQNSVLNLVNEYDKRINKILESYPFDDFLQRIILSGIDKSERDKIISIFRSGHYAFDTVALYLPDGKTVFSSPDKAKRINIYNYKNSDNLVFFDKDYDGVYFVKSISNEKGIKIGYIVASVFKKIFENTSYNLNFVVLPSGVVYYNPAIDINSISRDTLTQYIEKSNSETINIDNSSYLLHSSKVKGIENFSIGILELNVPIVQKYLKYVLLLILSSSFIFLIVSVLYDRRKIIAENQGDIYDEEEDYNINSINFNVDEKNENDFELLSEDDINYLNNINLEDILKEEYEDKKENIEEKKEEEKLILDDLENFDMPEDDKFDEKFDNENKEEIEDKGDNEEIKNNDIDLDDLEELYNHLEEMEKLDEREDNIAESIDEIEDIINDEEDILISHGSIIEDEITKEEDEYFSSSEAFNIPLNKDFLLGDEIDLNNINNIDESYNGEVVKKADENDTFDKEDLTDEELYNPEEVPKVPDDYYREAEEKVRENMTASWKKVLKSIRGKKFVNKNMNEILSWIKEQSGLDIVHCAMLNKGEDEIYRVSDSKNLSDSTKELLKIDENEGLFKKILSHNRTLYVSDPFSSDSLKDKFDISDRENIYHLIFIPVQDEEGKLKSFFIGLSVN